MKIMWTDFLVSDKVLKACWARGKSIAGVTSGASKKACIALKSWVSSRTSWAPAPIVSQSCKVLRTSARFIAELYTSVEDGPNG
jgi:hypothetical protein